jgi:murein DD-endopeptidase MepM/ murein hydrolase activator NlpD
MQRVLTVSVTLVLALAAPPGAAGWSWPVTGTVLRPFLFGTDPYAGGQHRGVDIGAGVGTVVVAPAAEAS